MMKTMWSILFSPVTGGGGGGGFPMPLHPWQHRSTAQIMGTISSRRATALEVAISISLHSDRFRWRRLTGKAGHLATTPTRWLRTRDAGKSCAKATPAWASCQRELDVKKLEREADRLACVSHHGFCEQRALTMAAKTGQHLNSEYGSQTRFSAASLRFHGVVIKKQVPGKS